MAVLAPVHKEGFSLVPDIGDRVITVKISGSCDSETVPLLDSFLGSLHLEVMRMGAQSVVVDCETLYFMNSASVKCFVMWLTKVRGMPLPKYQVRARTNRNLTWQGRTFGAIMRSAPDVLEID